MSPINYSKLRSLIAKTLVTALQQDGFTLIRHRGSHHQFVTEEVTTVTVILMVGG